MTPDTPSDPVDPTRQPGADAGAPDAGTPGAARPRVALFVTCLVDLFRPSIGIAAARLIERAGFTVVVPPQGCCGQPNWNGGDEAGARTVAVRLIETLAGFAHVVVPSGSCAAMMVHDYPRLFPPGDALHAQATDLARRTHELTCFLHEVAGMPPPAAPDATPIALHDSCSGLRTLGIKEQPRALLADHALVPLPGAEECCGFGGLFAAKHPDIATRIVDAKCAAIAASGAGTLVCGDLGCLMHIEGRLSRTGAAVRCLHVAELLDAAHG